DYVFLGDQLGGKPTDGPSSYAEVAQTASFHAGIERLVEIAQQGRTAIMCAEKDPITCHRFMLIARHLTGLGIAVEHIQADGSIETQHEAEDRLMTRLKIKPDLLTSRDERL